MSRALLIGIAIVSFIAGFDIGAAVIAMTVGEPAAKECPAADDSEDDFPDEWLQPIEATMQTTIGGNLA